jgi:hypothetical protein
MTESLGDAAQTRKVAEQVAEAVMVKVMQERPIKAEIPAPLKWASAIVAALFVMGVGATASWLVQTTNQTQLTVGRIEEGLKYMVDSQDRRFNEHERRIERLEEGIKE